MAHLYVESADGEHRVELVPDDVEGHWDGHCNRHIGWRLYDRNRFTLDDAHEEAAQHVDQR